MIKALKSKKNSKNSESFSNSNVKGKQRYHSKTREGDKNTVFIVVESGTIFCSSKIVYLQIDWFTEYNGITIEY